MATNETSRKGQCINHGKCVKANSREIIEVNLGEDFNCPQCKSPLLEVKKKKFPWWIVIVAAVLLIGGTIAALHFTGVIDCNKFIEPITALTKGKEAEEPAIIEEPAIVQEEVIIEEEPLPVFIQTISLNKSVALLKEREKMQLEWTVVPTDAIVDNLVWRSSDPTIATVKDGVVTAHNPGKTTIQLKDTIGNYAMTVCELTVEENPGNTLNFYYGRYTGEIRNGRANGFGKLTFTTSHRISEYDKNQQRMAEPGDYVEGQFENNNFYSGKWFDRYGNQKGAIILQKLGL